MNSWNFMGTSQIWTKILILLLGSINRYWSLSSESGRTTPPKKMLKCVSDLSKPSQQKGSHFSLFIKVLRAIPSIHSPAYSMPAECFRRCLPTCVLWKNSAALGLWKWIRPQSQRSLRLFPPCVKLWRSGWFWSWKPLSQYLFQKNFVKHDSRVITTKWFERLQWGIRSGDPQKTVVAAADRWPDLHCWMLSWRWSVEGIISKGFPYEKHQQKGHMW